MKNKTHRPVTLPIKNVIERIVENRDEWRFKLLRNWSGIMGPLSEKMRLERIVDEETLLIGVYDAHWMQELHMFSRTMITMINKQLNGHVIKKINLKLIAKKTPFIPRSQSMLLRSAKKPITSFIVGYKPNGREQKALDIIKDTQLKSTLHLFLKQIKEGRYS